MVGLDSVFRTVHVTLQLGVPQVAQRVNGANQFVIFEDGLARAIVVEEGKSVTTWRVKVSIDKENTFESS